MSTLNKYIVTRRTQTMRIASLFFLKGKNTNEIAREMNLHEATVWGLMDSARIIRAEWLDSTTRAA